MYSLVRHCYLERRRISLTGLLAFITGYALYSHINATAMGLPFPVFTGLFYMFAVGLAAAVSTYCFPKLCRLIDGITVARLGFAVWVIGTQNHEIAASPFISATIVVGGAILLLRFGTWIEAFSRIPTAAEPLVNFADRVRSFLDWLDNAAAYELACVKPSAGIHASSREV